MDSKLLAGAAIGIGFIGIAGYLIIGGMSSSDNDQAVKLASAAGQTLDIDTGSSAYDIEPIEVEISDEIVDEEAREPQSGRRNGGRGERGGNRFADMEARMMAFDTDGDGILDSTERDAMAESFRQRMIDRFDLDGDGMVSIEESFEARKEQMMNSRWGQRARNEYDADGDGELNPAEMAAYEQSIEDRFDREYDDILENYDLDADGEMSVEETLAMQEQQFQEQRARMDQFTQQFDQDGDGNLNADERIDVRDTMIERREMDSFLRRYDTNKDKEIGTSDYDRFTDAYGKKEPFADVNRDGIFNMDDIVMFRDFAERANGAID